MMNFKIKIMIIILTLFMLQAVSASDIDESVNIEINDIGVDEIIEVYEVGETSFSSEEDDNETVEALYSPIDDVDEVEDSIDLMDEYSHQEYNNSHIIETYEKSLEVKSDEHQYNNTYIKELLDDSLDNISFSNSNGTAIESYHLLSDFSNDYEVFIWMKFDSILRSSEYEGCEFKFDIFEEYDIFTHDFLIFYNHYCHILTHAVNKNVILCNDKLNSRFVFCIDNSILGNANNLYYNNPYFTTINFQSLSFLPSNYFLYNFYLKGSVYSFFSYFKQLNENEVILLEFN